MRVVSLVPSWTETLLECGVDVVGRTRFCIHPRDQVASIKTVGGTKQANWKKINDLNPDFLVLDKEENPKEFAEKADELGLQWMASHITDWHSLAATLDEWSQTFRNSDLKALSNSLASQLVKGESKCEMLPGIDWLGDSVALEDVNRIHYVIWRDPWMGVSSDTFIGAVLSSYGVGEKLVKYESRYPEFDLVSVVEPNDLILFSTEPYPFAEKVSELPEFGCATALVDGEIYSWFAIRAIRTYLNHSSS